MLVHRIAVACSVMTLALPCAAQSIDSVRLDVVRSAGADSCPDARRIAPEVTRRLGRDPFRLEADRTLEVLIAREPSRWRGDIVLRDATGAAVARRTIDSDSPECDALGRALSLALALAIDPDAADASAERRPARVPVVVPTRPTRSFDGGAYAVGGAGVGFAPGIAAFMAVGAELVLGPRWLLELAVMPESSTPDGRYGFSAWTAALGAGYEARVGSRVRLSIAGGVRAGAIHASVRSPALPLDPGPFAWFAFFARPTIDFVIAGPLAVRIGLDVFLPLPRWRFFVESRGGSTPNTVVFEQSTVAGDLWIGPVFRFP